MQALYESTKYKLNESEAEIFAAHLSVVEDPMIEDGVKDRIRDERMNVEQALKLTLDEIEALFAALDDEYLRERGLMSGMWAVRLWTIFLAEHPWM